MTDALYHDQDLAGFYDVDNGWSADREFCLQLGQVARSVLDLGCGTGALAARLGGGRRVVGVDPARAMLNVARARPGGELVTWLEGDVRTLRITERFELIVMSGHAFQCLLTDDDQAAACRTIAAHMEQGGRFIFDSRNPAGEEWREWTPDLSRRTVFHPSHGACESWNDVSHDGRTGIVTYGTYYRLPDGRVLSARSRIRFASRESIARCIAEAGLKVERWLGDWNGSEFTAGAPEFIALGTLT